MILSEDQVLAEIREAIRSVDGVTPEVAERIDAETNIVRDLRLDSLAVMDFIMTLESRFDTIVPIDTLGEIRTIGDLARVLGSPLPGTPVPANPLPANPLPATRG